MIRHLIGTILLLSSASLAGAEDFWSGSDPTPTASRPAFDLYITEGAAPGYVKDQLCAECHKAIAHDFEGHGMGRSFYRASADKAIEDFSKGYYHPPSGRHYQMELRQEAYWFTRWREAPDGTKLDQFEVEIDWIVGSGNHSRVYLVRTESGTLFQLPLAWYTEIEAWAMAPGFEHAEHMGLQRAVLRRCMACHNGYPDVPAGSDAYAMPAVFPEDLPEGIGCQRCHGPGAAHTELALQSKADASVTKAVINAAIVNPVDLPMARQRDLCNSCHFQPSVSVSSQLRLGEGSFGYTPGERLDQHLAQIDIEDRLRSVAERFDINHHPYRLEQSACFIQSAGALGCLTCHDPHRKRPKEERAAHYRAVCLNCHETIVEGGPEQNLEHPKLAANSDCTICHMPDRRTQDVVEVWMTDHKIQTPPPGNLLARIEKEPAEVGGISLIHHAPDLRHGEDVIYQTMAILQYIGSRADYAADALDEVLKTHNPPYFAPWLELAQARLVQGDHYSALRAASEAVTRAPDHPVPYKIAALTRYQMGDYDAALSLTKRSLALFPAMAEQHYNMALIHQALGDDAAALVSARRALELQFNLWSAWRLIGEISAANGDRATAIAAFEHALSIEPIAARVRPALVELLEAEGRGADADRHRAMLTAP